MKTAINCDNRLIAVIVLASLAIGILIGFIITSSYDSKFKDEIKELTESNNFKRELIRAYEDYYDADNEEDAAKLWAPIDSLYRSQI